MAKVLLGVTGSVAALRTPELFALLRDAGHDVKIVATNASLYFFDAARIDPANPAHPERNRDRVIIDADEWPGVSEGRRYQRDDPVLHIELRRWAEILVIAPLDANTLAKLGNGLSDNCLTCVWRAWDPARPVVLAPAMNTLMWEHPLTGRHLRAVAESLSAPDISPASDLNALIESINRPNQKLHIVPPISKHLACGDVGVGAMAELAAIRDAVANMLSR